MTGKPVDLDKRRGKTSMLATETRRERLYEFHIEQAAIKKRQGELEKLLLAAPAESWPEAMAKAQYLIQLFAGTVEGQSPRRMKLAQQTLDDISRLSGEKPAP